MNQIRSQQETPAEAIQQVFEAQRALFESGATLPRAFRDEQLSALLAVVGRFEKRIAEALWSDLRKNELEAYVTETSMMLAEIKHARKHLARWMKPSRWTSPLALQPARSGVHPEPLGPTVVFGAWNYPVQLSLEPAIAAIAAGNPVTVKPSELSPASSAVCAEILAEALDPSMGTVVEGGVPTAQSLLAHPWAHIFFTGGTVVGRTIARAGAEHLSRVTLELGGKSPCLVMPSATLDTAARRIAWAKWTNAGQTCVAPDYLLVHRSVHDDLVARLSKRVTTMYGDDPKTSPDFGRIVNERHFDRIRRLLSSGTVACGGQHDASERYIAPTILTDVSMDDPVMQEEIFGPILPVIAVDGVEEAIGLVQRRPNPLALYLYTEDAAEKDAVVQRVRFGGGAINHSMVHLGDLDLPFGGVGTSGIGAYHGKWGFDRFTHYKSVLEAGSSTLADPSVKYPPYKGKLGILKWLLG